MQAVFNEPISAAEMLEYWSEKVTVQALLGTKLPLKPFHLVLFFTYLNIEIGLLPDDVKFGSAGCEPSSGFQQNPAHMGRLGPIWKQSHLLVWTHPKGKLPFIPTWIFVHSSSHHFH